MKILAFMPNGGIRRFQRHGLKADGVYGKVDNLHISYDGNPLRISFSDGSYTENVYSASGEKLKVTHASVFRESHNLRRQLT